MGSDACVEPRFEFLPAPVVHTHLAASPALAATDQQGAAAAVEVGLAQRERFVDAKPGSPQHYDQAAQPATVQTVASGRITATISSTVGGSAG